MKKLTHRQQQVLDFIRDHIFGKGYPPTLREISSQFDLSGPRAAVKHLHALEHKGHIRRSPGSSRGIEVIAHGNSHGLSSHGDTALSRGIPVLGSVPAGPLDLAVQEEGNTLILDPSIAQDGTFLLKVKGDSMSGDHIVSGDMVLVKEQNTAAEGDLAVVLIGEEVTLKRFRIKGKKITLLPSNPDYKPVVVDGSMEDVKIIGIVKAVIRITDNLRGHNN